MDNRPNWCNHTLAISGRCLCQTSTIMFRLYVQDAINLGWLAVMLFEKRKGTESNFFASHAEISQDLKTSRTHAKALVLKMTQSNLMLTKAICGRSVDVGRGQRTTQPMRRLSLNLQVLSNFLKNLALVQKATRLIG